jgi:hypothetical protein
MDGSWKWRHNAQESVRYGVANGIAGQGPCPIGFELDRAAVTGFSDSNRIFEASDFDGPLLAFL